MNVAVLVPHELELADWDGNALWANAQEPTNVSRVRQYKLALALFISTT